MKEHILRGIEKVSALLDIEFSYTVAKHNFELGIPLENALKNWFSPYFPRRYAFGSGYMVDKDGKESNQTDWVIYDPLNFSPLIHKASLIDNVEFFLFDSVYGCVEVKRTLTSDSLDKAVRQLREMRSLQREESNPSFFHPLLSYKTIIPVDLSDINTNCLITAIYAYTSDDSIPNTFAELSAYIGNKYKFDDLPDIIAIHGKFIVFKSNKYIDEKGVSIINFSFNQKEMNSISCKDSGRLTSGYFYVFLLSMLQNTFLCAADYTNALYGIIKDMGLVATTMGKKDG